MRYLLLNIVIEWIPKAVTATHLLQSVNILFCGRCITIISDQQMHIYLHDW